MAKDSYKKDAQEQMSWQEQEMLKKRALIKKFAGLAVLVVIGLVGLVLSPKIFDTVEKGTYQIKQAAVTGTMSAKMDPGLWLQLFGDITVWPTAETFFFTKDSDEGTAADQSIEVRFNDGSLCDVSGTLRNIMPTNPQDAVNLVTVRGHKTYYDVQQKLILPHVRNSLRLTANLMSARESYAEKRTDFLYWAADQIQNGIYQTDEETKKIMDPITGEMVTRTVKRIKMGENGLPLRQMNPLQDTGIHLVNFEIKAFEYADKVKAQIGAQQEALMAVATARAKAQEAEQDKLTIEAQGEAKVAKARYLELEKKATAVVQAERDKEVAETHAQKELEVAKLAKAAAKETKEKDILLGQGQAEKKRLVMQADGALKQKLEALVEINKNYANAYKERKVPQVYMAGGSGANGTSNPDDEFSRFMNLMNIRNAKELAIDMNIKGQK